MPLLGLALNYTPFGIRLILVVLSVFTVSLAVIAYRRGGAFGSGVVVVFQNPF